MSPSNETEIKVHCTILVFDHENFLVTSTKIMDKRSVQNDYFADSSSVSLTNPFDNFIHPFERLANPFEGFIDLFGNFIHLFKQIANLFK